MFQSGRKEYYLIALLVAAVLFGGGFKFALYKFKGNEKINITKTEVVEKGRNENKLKDKKNKSEAEKIIYIHVAGTVEKPGLYKFPAGSRVNDAVEKAIPTEKADLNAINLAAVLSDGQKIYVPAEGEIIEEGIISVNNGTSVLTPAGTDGKVDINTAGQAQLESLPGVGPSLAKKIIEYRETKGYFKKIDDLKNVTGIGEKKFQSLKDWVAVY